MNALAIGIHVVSLVGAAPKREPPAADEVGVAQAEASWGDDRRVTVELVIPRASRRCSLRRGPQGSPWKGASPNSGSPPGQSHRTVCLFFAGLQALAASRSSEPTEQSDQKSPSACHAWRSGLSKRPQRAPTVVGCAPLQRPRASIVSGSGQPTTVTRRPEANVLYQRTKCVTHRWPVPSWRGLAPPSTSLPQAARRHGWPAFAGHDELGLYQSTFQSPGIRSTRCGYLATA
jgi:hypothetical protein